MNSLERAELTLIPNEELRKAFLKLRKALELKYKILDVLYPRILYRLDQEIPKRIDIREIHQENFEKLQAIKKLVEDFEI